MMHAFDPTGGKPGQVRFFLPGPVWVRDAVRQAMSHEAIGHRGKAFADLYSRIPPRLARVFRTRGFVFTTTSAGTGLWEAALLNLMPERVLALASGAFSERWAACARDLGLAVDVLETPWGAAVDPDEVRRALGRPGRDPPAQRVVASPAGFEGLFEDVVELNVEGEEVRGRRRVRSLVLGGKRLRLGEAQVMRPRPLLRASAEPIGGESEPEARRQREGLLRAGEGEVEAPGVALDRRAGDRCHDVGEHEGV